MLRKAIPYGFEQLELRYLLTAVEACARSARYQIFGRVTFYASCGDTIKFRNRLYPVMSAERWRSPSLPSQSQLTMKPFDPTCHLNRTTGQLTQLVNSESVNRLAN